MFYPSLEETRKYEKEYNYIPIAMEMYSDEKTTMQLLRILQDQNTPYYILESVTENGENRGRYSFIGYDPAMEITIKDEKVCVKENGTTTHHEQSPTDFLKQLIEKYKSPRINGMPPFTGGFVGYFAYDYIQYVENIKLTSEDVANFNDVHLMLFNKVIAYDHLRKKITLIINIPTKDIDTQYINGVTILKDMERLVLCENIPPMPKVNSFSQFVPNFKKDEYGKIIDKARSLIQRGELKQIVISNQQQADYSGSLLPVYRELRTTNPSAYMTYLQFGDVEIAGSSPETLISLKSGLLTSCPIAGTCKRGDNPQQEQENIDKMINDKKELLEHDMLVDLAVDDLGKVCSFNSIEVAEYQAIKKFSHVCHIFSKVQGTLDNAKDCIDVVNAVFPAGTVSGAPKLRSYQVIDELEGKRRGIYGGAIGYIDFTGNMDLCIGIRMAVKKYDTVYVQSGGGIVIASDNDKEFEETINKADAVIEAVKRVGC